jgi:hypothetical protein
MKNKFLKMNKINLSILVVSFGLLFGGCKKSFLDINKNPNVATESSITPDLTLAAQLANTAARNATAYDFLQRYMGYWSASGSYSRSTVEMSYNITNDFGTGIWNGIYYTVGQYKSIEKKSNELGWKYYEGISKIMQAFEIGVLVDVYGNIPYNSAWDLAGNIRPSYDKGEDVYKALLPMIDAGMALIKNAAPDRNIGTQDIVFQGNKTNWARFGNTLKLRFLLHAFKTNVFDRSAEIAKITAEGSGFLGNGIGAMVQPGYTSDKPNPFYRSHLFLVNGNEADNYNRANNFSLDLMKNLSDPRHTRVYRAAKSLANQYRGTDYGQNPNDDVNSDRTSGPGFGLAASATVPMWIMTSVESMFLVAEATARGWISGNSQTAYENAVRQSFTYLGLTVAAADTYLGSVNPRVAWPTSGALNDQIAVIAWQKYFALNGTQANETWTDWRRLGVVQPPLSLAPERGSNPIPRRLLYPTTEYQYNKENAPAGISPFTSKIFWDL